MPAVYCVAEQQRIKERYNRAKVRKMSMSESASCDDPPAQASVTESTASKKLTGSLVPFKVTAVI
jgi:hypothetical protein